MDKIKANNIVKRIKIKPAFFIYVVIFFFIALILSVITIQLFDNYVSTVAVYYIHTNEDVNRVNEDDDEDVRIALELIDDDFDESHANAILFYARNSTIAVVLILYFILGISIASRLFFKRKLDEPLRKLSAAAKKISEEDLDFEIEYDGSDEMAKLCHSYEKMRQQLVKNNQKMWDMIAEQKRVQHAFSHDIRTPLTVIMGYFDILHEYLPNGKLSQKKTEETLEIIQKNLLRLENFVNMMGNMQKLDDIEANIKSMDIKDFFDELQKNSKMICWDKQLNFISSADCEYAMLDKKLVDQIIMNIVSNASRYSNEIVTMNCKYENNKLTVVIQDDGKGFSEEALRHAFESYFTEEDKSNSDHFGMGLSICQKLCEKLGGNIYYENDNGAKVTVSI